MYSLEKPILQNPFHPLDLTPQDFLRIYNRFQQSRLLNKNPQQELSIDIISQLISSLKGIKPSYVQKCLTQSFIKPTISWNDFLTLLDHESEIRQKILAQILFYDEASVKRYKLQRYLPFRTKVQKAFDFVTFIKLIPLGGEKICIVELDHQKLCLIDVAQNNFKELDRFQKKNSKTNLQFNSTMQNKNSSKLVNVSKMLAPFPQSKKTSGNISSKFQSQKLMTHNSIIQAGGNGNIKSSQLGSNEDDELYFKKQKRNIHSVFNIFKNLQIQDSITLANVTASKISDKSFNIGHVNTIRDAFGQKMIQEKEKLKDSSSKCIAPFERAQRKLKSLYDQKSKLSYNPYRVKRHFMPTTQDLSQTQHSSIPNQKKIIHDRKQKSYTLESVAISFCSQISCLVIAYHNLQILILKVGRDLNRIGFEEQDLIKIVLEKDHKVNQIIEEVKFYHHTIRDKWFLLVLIRVEYKSEGKSHTGESYVLGYEVQQQENKRKTGFSYKFKCNKDQSLKKQCFRLDIENFEATILQVEPRFGIHLVSFNGKYFTFREEYIQNLTNPSLSQYWKLKNEEKFKNLNLSLGCISIGSTLNKVLFGTNNGNVVLYDVFSHQYKIKKLSPHPIVNVQIFGCQGFALTQDQKIIILNLLKFEEIISFNTVNQEKLHQKVLNFQFDQKSKEIWTFGSQIKVYNQQTDQNQLHKKRQMQKTYTWRLTKLKNQIDPKDSLKERIEGKLSSQKLIKTKNQPQLKSSELVISSGKYFVMLTQILEVVVIEKSTLKVKFTFILSIPYDSKVIKIAISQSQKLLAVLLFNQSIYVFNIYTQQLCLHVKPVNLQKFISICFLDAKNEYMLAAGTESGKIGLIPYCSVPEKPISYLKYHIKPVTNIEVRNNILVTCGECGKVGIWQLPFNVIKHQFKLPASSKYISKIIGFHSSKTIYMKSIDDEIFEFNMSSVKITKMQIADMILDPQATNIMSVDAVTNQLFLFKQKNLIVFSKNNQTNQWIQKHKTKIFDENSKEKHQQSDYGQLLQIGVVESEKAVLFYEGGGAFPYNYQSRKVGKYITFNE